MKNKTLKTFLLGILLSIGLILPTKANASHIEIKPCVEINHCIREEWNVEGIDNPFENVQEIIKNTPRAEIVTVESDYLRAEYTSRIMKYIDDLEVSYSSDSKKLIVRSESRVGDGDFGVNKKRVDLLRSQLF